MSETTSSGGEERAAHKGTFATIEEAQQVERPSDKFRLFQVFKGATSLGYTWAWAVDGAITNVARNDGYAAKIAEPKGAAPLTAERAAAKLAELSDEELAALGLARKKAKK